MIDISLIEQGILLHCKKDTFDSGLDIIYTLRNDVLCDDIPNGLKVLTYFLDINKQCRDEDLIETFLFTSQHISDEYIPIRQEYYDLLKEINPNTDVILLGDGNGNKSN